jgi:glycosyltransferase involved in cell wall biosynthesis
MKRLRNARLGIARIADQRSRRRAAAARERDSDTMSDPVMQSALLFVLDQPPWPLRRNGLTIRYHPILTALAARSAVDVVLLPGDRDGEIHCDDPLRRILRSVRRVDRVQLSEPRRWLRRARFWAGYASPCSDPAICHAYEQPELEDALRTVLAGERYDAVVLASAKHAALARRLRALVACRTLVVDWIDSLALLVERGSFEAGGGTLRSFEARRLRRLEREVARLADRVVYVSRVDADHANAGSEKVRVIPNGVSTIGWTPELEHQPARWSIGFFGNMSYWPNVHAALWLADRVLPRVRRAHPDASLAIIGRNPSPEIRRLADREAVTVTGDVENVWDYVCAVRVCALPMREGAGIQNKVLEALYAGRPVVTTSIGNEGIDAAPGREILVSDDEAGFADAIDRLLRDPAAARDIARAGRAFARARFGWDGVIESFEAVLHG